MHWNRVEKHFKILIRVKAELNHYINERKSGVFASDYTIKDNNGHQTKSKKCKGKN